MATYGDQNTRPQDAAKEEAANVAAKAQGAAQEVAGTARQETREVAGAATDQIKSLLTTAQDEAFAQASTQQAKLAEQSRIVSDDLQRLSRGEQPESDLVNQLISTAATRVESFTSQLENKEPADLLRDVRRFAARRPGTFLAIAAGVGLVAGRLTRGLSDNDSEDSTVRGDAAPLDRSPAAPVAPVDPVGYGESAVSPLVGGLDDTPEFTATGEYVGTIPGEVDAEASRIPFTDPTYPEDRR